MTTLRLVKSIGSSSSRLALLLIPLVFACFAIPAMGERDKTPNHKEINLNTITQGKCTGEKVDIRAEGKLKFGFREFAGHRFFMPVDRDLAIGIGRKNCPNSGQCDVGRGQTPGIGRVYTADTRIGFRGVENNVLQNGDRFGTCELYLLVTGVPNRPPQGDIAPGRQTKFRVFYNVYYEFNSDHQVTVFKATPAAPHTIECIH